MDPVEAGFLHAEWWRLQEQHRALHQTQRMLADVLRTRTHFDAYLVDVEALRSLSTALDRHVEELQQFHTRLERYHRRHGALGGITHSPTCKGSEADSSAGGAT